MGTRRWQKKAESSKLCLLYFSSSRCGNDISYRDTQPEDRALEYHGGNTRTSKHADIIASCDSNFMHIGEVLKYSIPVPDIRRVVFGNPVKIFGT